MSKKHGWVLQDMDETNGFVQEDGDVFDLEYAWVFKTRAEARESLGKMDSDVVRKVSLDKDGEPIEIVKGR